MTTRHEYERMDNIGEGSFGCVYCVRRKSDGKLFAAKKTKGQSISMMALIKEVECLTKCLGCPNVVQMEDHIRDDRTQVLCVIMELADTNLLSLMKRPENYLGLPSDTIIDLIADMNCGLQYFKDIKFAHRDIKVANILVFKCFKRRTNFLFKFCDLGGSRDTTMAGEEMMSLVGSKAVLPLPLANQLAHKERQPYTAEQVDLWCTGATLFYVATGTNAFEIKDNKQYYDILANRQKGQICYSPVTKQYYKNMDNPKYDKWFNFALSRLIACLFDTPSYAQLNEMATELSDAKELTFILPNQPKIIKYADLSDCLHFTNGYPTLNDILQISENKPAYLISEDGIATVKSLKPCESTTGRQYLVVGSDDVLNNKLTCSDTDWRSVFRPTTNYEELIGRSYGVQEECQRMIDQHEASVTLLKKCFSKVGLSARDCQIKLQTFLLLTNDAPVQYILNDFTVIIKKALDTLNKIKIAAEQVEKKQNEKQDPFETYCSCMISELDLYSTHVNITTVDSNHCLTKLYSQIEEERKRCEEVAKRNSQTIVQHISSLVSLHNTMITYVQEIENIYVSYKKNLHIPLSIQQLGDDQQKILQLALEIKTMLPNAFKCTN